MRYALRRRITLAASLALVSMKLRAGSHCGPGSLCSVVPGRYSRGLRRCRTTGFSAVRRRSRSTVTITSGSCTGRHGARRRDQIRKTHRSADPGTRSRREGRSSVGRCGRRVRLAAGKPGRLSARLPGEHGIFVDANDNVWITGNGDVVLKFSKAGKFLLQIGESSADRRAATIPSCSAIPLTSSCDVADERGVPSRTDI